jgi:hypothetical protein
MESLEGQMEENGGILAYGIEQHRALAFRDQLAKDENGF